MSSTHSLSLSTLNGAKIVRCLQTLPFHPACTFFKIFGLKSHSNHLMTITVSLIIWIINDNLHLQSSGRVSLQKIAYIAYPLQKYIYIYICNRENLGRPWVLHNYFWGICYVLIFTHTFSSHFCSLMVQAFLENPPTRPWEHGLGSGCFGSECASFALRTHMYPIWSLIKKHTQYNLLSCDTYVLDAFRIPATALGKRAVSSTAAQYNMYEFTFSVPMYAYARQ